LSPVSHNIIAGIIIICKRKRTSNQDYVVTVFLFGHLLHLATDICLTQKRVLIRSYQF